jgi:hypothetical protein
MRLRRQIMDRAQYRIAGAFDIHDPKWAFVSAEWKFGRVNR